MKSIIELFTNKKNQLTIDDFDDVCDIIFSFVEDNDLVQQDVSTNSNCYIRDRTGVFLGGRFHETLREFTMIFLHPRSNEMYLKFYKNGDSTAFDNTIKLINRISEYCETLQVITPGKYFPSGNKLSDKFKLPKSLPGYETVGYEVKIVKI